jgi:hypothetical protein
MDYTLRQQVVSGTASVGEYENHYRLKNGVGFNGEPMFYFHNGKIKEVPPRDSLAWLQYQRDTQK